ncbi:hypothetical protein [Thermospira aquatica]|uniref:DUF1772 domain-containing protein n=1 Tax=Thermospira aquatica TaxID=2828656 RepID=A0AAX3BBW2_9SPIR|nr:hypothetical protein [Thermospira aquatica]URA09611.1 hypothetical protein KDW03_08955 [Thermospira aquatica]
MIAVFLVFVILLWYSFFMTLGQQKTILNVETNPSLKNFYDKCDAIAEKGSFRFIMGLAGLVFGVWNLFAPDFGHPEYGPTLFGALIPSAILLLNGLVWYENVVDLFNITDEQKQSYHRFIEAYKPWGGLITFIVAWLHLALAKVVFF